MLVGDIFPNLPPYHLTLAATLPVPFPWPLLLSRQLCPSLLDSNLFFAVFWTAHFLLYLVRHIDQSEPIEHSIYVGHSPDIAQSFRAVYHFSFNILQRQNYRTPCQTLTLLPAVDPQRFRVLTVPAFLIW